jgi:hypothetical protein
MIYTIHEVAGEHTGNTAAGMENAWSLGQFIPSIPWADDVLHSRVESTFRKTLESLILVGKSYLETKGMLTNEEP